MLPWSTTADAGKVRPRASGALVLRVLVLACVAAAGVLGRALPAQGAAGAAPEYAVKAAFLYKFGFFVEWPPARLAGADEPLNLCIAGVDPFGPTLEQVLGTQRIQNHPVAVRRLLVEDDHAECHILFISGSDAALIGRIVDNVSGRGVLTVTELDFPLGSVGIINFVIANNRVRFDIDAGAARDSGLVISSKLLGLALNVRQR